MINLNKELEVALLAINKASEAILEIYNTNFEVNIKKDKSEVTNADIKSECIIKGFLTEHFKNYSILSEESIDDLNRINNDFCWIVDPLDGTKDFVNKTNNFAINIALAYKNEIVLGVICVPFYNIVYYATKGHSAYKIENNITTKIKVSNRKEKLHMVTSKFFFVNDDTYQNNRLIGDIQAIGSSYKAGLIAEGKADLCIKVDPNSKEWDTAPSEIIIAEAGGIMTNIYGEKMSYNKKDVYNHDGFIITNCIDNLNVFKKTR